MTAVVTGIVYRRFTNTLYSFITLYLSSVLLDTAVYGMDYSKVAAKLSFIAAGLSKLLGGGTLPPPGLDNKLIIKGDDTDEHENERPEADGAGDGSGR